MRRVHLFEFTDLEWFPQVLRDAETAYLAASYRLLRSLPRAWALVIAPQFTPSEPPEILDLCSGSGGPVPAVIEELEKLGINARARLSDLYPNQAPAQYNRITWIAEPLDASRVPANLTGVRTMFAGFHHFRPETAKAILENAFDQRRPICIFEAGSKTIPTLVSLLGVPVAVLLLMPFARPFRWVYLLFTYLIPILPFIVLWDGVVSWFRFYTPHMLRDMTAGLSAQDYRWESGSVKAPGVPSPLPYFIGRPVRD
jgi:hypothetical protein